MSHATLLANLLPPVSYAPTMPVLSAELAAEGGALDIVQVMAEAAIAGISPEAPALLPDWERVCGVVPPAGATTAQRIQTVQAKLAETGGLSIAYFTRLAAMLGYQITIHEPQPLCAGTARAGQRCAGLEVIWWWRVVVSPLPPPGRVPLASAQLETTLRELAPADTWVSFHYEDALRVTESGDERAVDTGVRQIEGVVT